MDQQKWLDWVTELQFLAQGGLTYTKNKYDQDRFARIREIAGEMLAAQNGAPMEKIRDVFLNETGYQTPKIETRAAVFRGDRILMVHETIDGRWSLPGGWCDVNCSVAQNAVKETREEAGLEVRAVRLIALHDFRLRNGFKAPYGILKAFVLCEETGEGRFRPNVETSECGWFTLDSLPELSSGRNSEEQIRMCFEARSETWETRFD